MALTRNSGAMIGHCESRPVLPGYGGTDDTGLLSSSMCCLSAWAVF